MNPVTNRSSIAVHARRPSLLTPLFLLCAPLAAQNLLDIKPPTTPDPVKGWADTSPVTPEELERLHGHRRQHATLPAGVQGETKAVLDRVLFDRPGDDRLWAVAPAYKCSFGPDGFVYIPFFGSEAPRDFPLQFVLQSVRVGGADLPLGAAEPVRSDTRVTFDRGAVQERYDLRLDDVEQTFVIDSPRAGDVDIVLRVAGELVAATAGSGIQFANEHGRVDYGQAHVVAGAELLPVATTYSAGAIHIHVPASLRGNGPLVVDPFLHASPFSQVTTQVAGFPDIAYDAFLDQFLVVWQLQFSAADTDVYCEFRFGNGPVELGSLDIIDITSADHRYPCVGNLHSANRFLVVSQRFEAGHWQIWGRMRSAGQPVNTGPFPITDATSLTGESWNPDIGGDSSSAASADSFLVVWERQFSATDYDILGRLVHSNATLGNIIPIENSGSTVYQIPSVAQSNGAGLATAARWMVVYQFRFSPSDIDIYGASLAQNGTITAPSQVVDGSFESDLYPSVSSPNTDSAGGNPLFLVTYERQAPLEARARLLSAQFVNQIAPVNLTWSFGLGPLWVRCECDGNRFAVTAGGNGIGVATFAYDGAALVMNEAPQTLAGAPSYPRLCSKRSGGGPRTQYGITHVDESTTPFRIITGAYFGRAPGPEFVRRTIGCGPAITPFGNAFLGEIFTFGLGNIGSDIPGFVFGAPMPASTLFCSACPLGVDPVGAILSLGQTFGITAPTTASLVGYSATVQGFTVGSGPCAAGLRFSDAIDVTIR